MNTSTFVELKLKLHYFFTTQAEILLREYIYLLNMDYRTVYKIAIITDLGHTEATSDELHFIITGSSYFMEV